MGKGVKLPKLLDVIYERPLCTLIFIRCVCCFIFGNQLECEEDNNNHCCCCCCYRCWAGSNESCCNLVAWNWSCQNLVRRIWSKGSEENWSCWRMFLLLLSMVVVDNWSCCRLLLGFLAPLLPHTHPVNIFIWMIGQLFFKKNIVYTRRGFLDKL